MEYLFERILWGLYDSAEVYTFLLSWLVFPLFLVFSFQMWKRLSVPVATAEVHVAPEVAPPQPAPEAKVQETKVNKNEANA